MTFYKQFQNDFPTYIIKIVCERERIALVCVHTSISGNYPVEVVQ